MVSWRFTLLAVLGALLVVSVACVPGAKTPAVAKPTPPPVTSMAAINERLAGLNKDLADLAAYYAMDVADSKQKQQSLNAISQQLAAIEKRLTAIEARLSLPTPTPTAIPVAPKPSLSPTAKPVSYFVPSVPVRVERMLGSAVAIPATIGCDL